MGENGLGADLLGTFTRESVVNGRRALASGPERPRPFGQSQRRRLGSASRVALILLGILLSRTRLEMLIGEA
jgi:hypothetical protein